MLKPCPFCGDEHPEITSGDLVMCGTETCFGNNTFDLWNNRTPQPHIMGLVWTHKTPSVPGWYWGRYPHILDLVMVHVGQEAIARAEFMPGSQWAGPIPEPREPGEEG